MIGQRVIELRTARNWDQTELASRAQLPRATVSRVENNKRTPRLDVLCRIKLALGVTMDDLTSGACAQVAAEMGIDTSKC